MFQYRHMSLIDYAAYVASPVGREHTPWWMEATAEWAGREFWRLHDSTDPVQDHAYSDDIATFLADPSHALGEFSKEGAFGGVSPRVYGSFPVAAYLERTVPGGVLGTWWEIGKGDDSDALTAIERVLGDAGREYDDWLPELWQATYLLENANPPGVPRFDDPDVWVWRNGAGRLGDSPATQGDAHSSFPRAHRAVADGVELTAGPPVVHEDLEVSDGGALFIDVRLEDGLKGTVSPLVWVDEEQVDEGTYDQFVGSWVTYDPRGYPHVCEREDAVVVEGFRQRPGFDEALWEVPVTLDEQCPTATLILAQTDPYEDGEWRLNVDLLLEDPEEVDAGGLDTVFGRDGRVLMDGYDEVVDLAVQPDGKVVALLDRADHDFAVVRLTPDGDLDDSFSGDGIAEVPIPSLRIPRRLGLGAGDTGDEIVVLTTYSWPTERVELFAFDSSGNLANVVLDSAIHTYMVPEDFIVDSEGRPVLLADLTSGSSPSPSSLRCHRLRARRHVRIRWRGRPHHTRSLL